MAEALTAFARRCDAHTNAPCECARTRGRGDVLRISRLLSWPSELTTARPDGAPTPSAPRRPSAGAPVPVRPLRLPSRGYPVTLERLSTTLARGARHPRDPAGDPRAGARNPTEGAGFPRDPGWLPSRGSGAASGGCRRPSRGCRSARARVPRTLARLSGRRANLSESRSRAVRCPREGGRHPCEGRTTLSLGEVGTFARAARHPLGAPSLNDRRGARGNSGTRGHEHLSAPAPPSSPRCE